MDLNKKIEISLKDLLEFASWFDDNGENNYPEHEYEGKTVISVLVNKVLGSEVSVEFDELFIY